jgi:hypothetical protein
MGFFIDRQNGTFEIEYGGESCPFGGLSSEAPPPYIKSGDMIQCQNFLVSDNALVSANFQSVGNPSAPFEYVSAQGPVAYGVGFSIGFADLLGVFFDVQLSIVGTNATVSLWNISNGLFNQIGQSVQVPLVSTTVGSLTFKNVNGICYFSFGGSSCILQTDTNTVSITTNLLGCQYLTELNGRLLAGFCFVPAQTVSGVPTPAAINPFEVAWCAEEEYGIWYVLDSNNLVTGAGYNFLPDVEDYITGFLTIGTACYVMRPQGITEITPLSSGIEPFDFNHLWASHKGVGSLPNPPVQQFGPNGFFQGSADFYYFGDSGLSTFSGAALSTLFKGIILPAANTQVSPPLASIGPVFVNQSPENYYVITSGSVNAQSLGVSNSFPLVSKPGNNISRTQPSGPIFNINAATQFNFQTFLGNYRTKQWFSLSTTFEIDVSQNAAVVAVSLDSVNTTNNLGLFILGVQVVIEDGTYATQLLTLQTEGANNSIVQFKIEEVIFGIEKVIDAVGFYAYTDLGATVVVSVSGVFFNPVDMTVPGWNYYVTTPVKFSYVGNAPQLNMAVNTTTGQFILGKVKMYGSYDPTQRPI